MLKAHYSINKIRDTCALCFLPSGGFFRSWYDQDVGTLGFSSIQHFTVHLIFLIYTAHMVSWRLRKHLEDNMLPSQRLTVDVYIRHIYMCGPIKSSDKWGHKTITLQCNMVWFPINFLEGSQCCKSQDLIFSL